MIEIDRLEYVHATGVPAIQGVTLSLARGQWTALIGPNGSGKTTLARCLNGLLLPTSGRVRVGGVTLSERALSQVRRRVAMVFQNPDDQLVAPTVETDIAFGLENHGVDPGHMRRRVDEVLDLFHLQPYRHHPPHLLSGGERQRLAVAAAVAVRPDFLILDEPTALLDPGARSELMDLIERLCRESGLGVLHITQSPEEAARAERILVLNEGCIVADGDPRDIFSRAEELAGMGLAVPFSVAVAAAGGGTTRTLYPGELSAWLVREFRPPLPESRPVAGTVSRETQKLATEHLSHVYRAGVPQPVHALRSVDMSVPQGAISALVGPSGSGKTTLVQHFNGLLHPTTGTVRLDGRNIWADGDSRAARRQVGLVFQFPESQLFEETVATDVRFGPRNHGCSTEQSDQRAAEALAMVGLPVDRFGGRAPLALSGGERRRAAIAGVLAIRPAVLVLDEPTAGLDPANEQLIADLLSGLAADGVSVVLVSHDMDRVAELAASVTVMEQGQVRWCGPTRQVLEQACCQDNGATVKPPAALALSLDLRRRGWQTPSLLTREEACHFVSRLQRRQSA
ncbi:MAG: energy-coupling factor transporter ATPase [Candidatus Latescibacteria bacterium]|jgi:energy-coupling factor transport system ATP-binding protein|nr:energy-coupling factor transporter ATPase [Gemmatimonadaceae bacterium]MDP6017462.1 energy-coupling factor transporter ATPase [Candidatus Latescibacterota bacterium]MDP7447832.1 energy-coupling factor transporter ATPase [Candidatus Latescibacterota bacterium]HJP33750.1 energy-coupling factor transporter ATPase [Candidatus Latescibacterota bacterium]